MAFDPFLTSRPATAALVVFPSSTEWRGAVEDFLWVGLEFILKVYRSIIKLQ